jgi:hypothetical protein
MMTDRNLDEILDEIGREHRAIGAPESVEHVLCAATIERRRAAGGIRLRAAWAWGFAIVLLIAIASSGVVWKMQTGHKSGDGNAQPNQAQSVPAHPAKPASPPSSMRAAVKVGVQSASRPLHKSGRAAAPSVQAADSQSVGNSLQEFVPLPVSEGLPPAGELSLVRVRLQGSDLQQYGLEAPADAAVRMLLAEFVVGEDGLPRAIRIVQ